MLFIIVTQVLCQLCVENPLGGVSCGFTGSSTLCRQIGAKQMHLSPFVDGGIVLHVEREPTTLHNGLATVSQYNSKGNPFNLHQHSLGVTQDGSALHVQHSTCKDQIVTTCGQMVEMYSADSRQQSKEEAGRGNRHIEKDQKYITHNQ